MIALRMRGVVYVLWALPIKVSPMSIRSNAAMLFTTAIAVGSFADEPMRTAVLDDDDSMFFRKAASADMLEVESGKLAARQATNLQLKEFGRKMATDHARATAELRALAARKRVALPAAMSDDDQKKLAKLREEKPGKDFDARFRDLMVDSHEDAVSLFEHTAKDSKDRDVEAFAAKMLPKLQQHEAAAKALPTIAEAPASAPPTPVTP
jgi:putative membrane protein